MLLMHWWPTTVRVAWVEAETREKVSLEKFVIRSELMAALTVEWQTSRQQTAADC